MRHLQSRKSAPAIAALVRERRLALANQIARLTGSQEMCETAIPGLLLFRRTSEVTPACAVYEPSLAVIAQGRKRVDLGSRSIVYDESRYLITSLDLPIISQVMGASERQPFLALVLRLDIPMVRELLSREEFPAASGALEQPAMVTGEITLEMLDACGRMLDLLYTPSDIGYLSGLIQRELAYRILKGPAAGRLRAIATLGDPSQRTAKAIAWLRANYARPLRVEELAQLAGMGVSTFHYHFRAATAMSPLQYQKQLRLHVARGRMMEGLDASSAAFEVGYASASQFNREYSRFFGRPPGRDRKTWQSASA